MSSKDTSNDGDNSVETVADNCDMPNSDGSRNEMVDLELDDSEVIELSRTSDRMDGIMDPLPTRAVLPDDGQCTHDRGDDQASCQKHPPGTSSNSSIKNITLINKSTPNKNVLNSWQKRSQSDNPTMDKHSSSLDVLEAQTHRHPVENFSEIHEGGTMKEEELQIQQLSTTVIVYPAGKHQIVSCAPQRQQRAATAQTSISANAGGGNNHQCLQEPGAQFVPGARPPFYRIVPPPRPSQLAASTMDFTVTVPQQQPQTTEFLMMEADASQTAIKADKVEVPVLAEASVMRHRSGKLIFRGFAVVFMITMLILGIFVAVTCSKHSIRCNEQDDSLLLEKVGTLAPTTNTPTPSLRPMLETILERGVLRCAMQGKLEGFSMWNETSKERSGFELDLCRGVAAAIFGCSSSDTAVADLHNRIEPIIVGSAERWMSLANASSSDLITRTTTHTMERDIYQKDAQTGFTFSTPYLYEGLGFAGIPPYASCADELRVTGECRDLTICTFRDSTHSDILGELVPMSRLVVVNASYTRLDGFMDGACNVMAGISQEVSEVVVRNAGYKGPYEVGTAQFSKEPLALVTREEDDQWSVFVDLVLQALLEAETQGVTQETANLFTTTVDAGKIFGPPFHDMFVHAIRAVGNYGELYQRHIEPIVPRKLVNTAATAVNVNVDHSGSNTSTSSLGIVYSLPMGDSLTLGPGPIPGGTLEQVTQRGYLRCGILTDDRPGFGYYDARNVSWHGLDAEYCRVVSATVFAGIVQSVDFVPVRTEEEGMDLLRQGQLDILSGVSVRMAPTSEGIILSLPYFYQQFDDNNNNNNHHGNNNGIALATRSDDHQWSDFCFWSISATIFAEEHDISSLTSNNMPGVNLLGPLYQRMFRDTILVSGNYGEIMMRVEEEFGGIFQGELGGFRRDTLNTLNNGNPRGPQFFPFL